MTLAFNLVAALAYAVGAVFMKASDGLRNVKAAAMVYVLFAFGATLQAIAMRKAEVGVSNTIVLGVEAVGSVALGVLLFRESVTGTKLGAVALVSVGVYLLRQG